MPAQPSALIYNNLTPLTNMNPSVISPVGGSQPHTNFQPYLCVDFIISLDGYAAADDWPGLWGLGGPEYFTWLEQLPDRDHPGRR